MPPTSERPISPHLTAYKWGSHMLVSILHRITGAGLSIVGGIVLVWWLMAAAAGGDSYGKFAAIADSWPGIVVLVGLSWAMFQHLLSGLRHFVMDIGAGFELSTNKRGALATLAGSALLTAALWLYIFKVRNGL